MTGQADQPGEAGHATVKFDTSKPNVARVYDYLLGGKDNFAADRQAAERLLAELPNAGVVAKANRTFLAAAVRHAAREGLTQYLDVGAGLPTSPSVHECARAIVPDARVAYVDSDPVAVRHAQALLATDGVIATAGNALEPEAILADPAVAGLIDMTQPVCLMLVSMLHFFTPDQADMIVGAFRQRLVPGSYLIISQGQANKLVRPEGIQKAYGRDITLAGRSPEEIAAYFDGFDLIPPGLVPVAEWPAAQPDAWPPPRQQGQRQGQGQGQAQAQSAKPEAGMLAGIGRKRA